MPYLRERYCLFGVQCLICIDQQWQDWAARRKSCNGSQCNLRWHHRYVQDIEWLFDLWLMKKMGVGQLRTVDNCPPYFTLQVLNRYFVRRTKRWGVILSKREKFGSRWSFPHEIAPVRVRKWLSRAKILPRVAKKFSPCVRVIEIDFSARKSQKVGFRGDFLTFLPPCS